MPEGAWQRRPGVSSVVACDPMAQLCGPVLEVDATGRFVDLPVENQSVGGESEVATLAATARLLDDVDVGVPDPLEPQFYPRQLRLRMRHIDRSSGKPCTSSKGTASPQMVTFICIPLTLIRCCQTLHSPLAVIMRMKPCSKRSWKLRNLI